MTSNDPAPATSPTLNAECPAGRWWMCALLGLILVVSGIFVLLNAVLVSLVTAVFFAAALMIAGLFQIIQAFSARGWASLVFSVVIGLVSIAAGLVLMTDPLATSFVLTAVVAALFLASGLVRLWLSIRHGKEYGWVLGLSGAVGIGFGMLLVLGYPWDGLIVPGLLLGIDFVFHGAWWLVMAVIAWRAPARGHALPA